MTSRYWPECKCAQQQARELEEKVLGITCQALLGTIADRAASGMCPKSESYISITMMAMLVSGLACNPDGSKPGVIVPERYEAILSTLADDVRQRVEELEAFKQKLGATQQ